jgi:RNA polymerase sigma-70 factor (ECF subfamily)
MTEKNNDFNLIERFNNGDESAFNEIARKYQQKIYWHARRMTGNHLDADEIVQEVFLVMYKKLNGFKFRSSLYTWIYTITSTRSINLLRRRSVKEMFSLQDSAVDRASDSDIIKDFENKEEIRRLENHLQKIPVKQREVFILRAIDGLSYEEISEMTGKSVGGLKSNYFHALKKITRVMQNEKQ